MYDGPAPAREATERHSRDCALRVAGFEAPTIASTRASSASARDRSGLPGLGRPRSDRAERKCGAERLGEAAPTNEFSGPYPSSAVSPFQMSSSPGRALRLAGGVAPPDQ
jgi:hypothetical protein